jgi:hypothetical protein
MRQSHLVIGKVWQKPGKSLRARVGEYCLVDGKCYRRYVMVTWKYLFVVIEDTYDPTGSTELPLT